jgi:hypothetical protein
MRELGRLVFLILTILSLYALLDSAFFTIGSHWQNRLEDSILTLGIATCVCFAGGIVFSLTESSNEAKTAPLSRTLPVQLYYWTVGGTVLLFFLSWYLEQYYIPMIYKNQPW